MWGINYGYKLQVLMHQSIPAVPEHCPPPPPTPTFTLGWTPDIIIINFYCLRWQIPWGGTLELSNHPLGWGRKREQMPRPPWTLQHFSLTALLSSAILSIFNVRFFVSVYVCLCNNTIQTRPGGVVGYQYTRYFAPKIPIYLKIVKCVILNT